MIIKRPKIVIKAPDVTFYRAAAVEAKKRIRRRTETDGLDYRGQKFTPYSEYYKQYRLKKGRSGQPNLSFTGKMLTSMSAYSTTKSGHVALSGYFGNIARGNESNGRVFFALSSKDKSNILKTVGRWMAKKNRLK